jgi:peptide/nickel transport system permease protein
MATDATVSSVEAALGSSAEQALTTSVRGQPRLWVWILRRLGLSVLTLLGVSILVFAATEALPGNPAREILGRVSNSALVAFDRAHGLTGSLVSRYFSWLHGVVTGHLGRSLASHQTVLSIIGSRGLNTLALVLFSAAIAIGVGMLIGTLSAVFHDRPFDHGTQVLLLVLTSLPEFVIGLFMLIIFATTLFTILPSVAVIPAGQNAFEHPTQLVLPVLTLALAVVPYLARLQRGTMIDVLDSEFVHMARLKGVREAAIIRRHALRNSLVAVIQGSSLTLIYLTGGVVTIEYLFAFPGLGSELTAAVQSRDLPVIQGVVLTFAAVYVVVNLCADLLTVLVTPRLRTRFR